MTDAFPRTILVLGATGMLGNAVLRFLSGDPRFEVYGTARSAGTVSLLPKELHERVLTGVDGEQPDSLARALARTQPDVVINCIGLIKQLSESEDPLSALPINSILPHRLQRLCAVRGARLVHVSTDCVFSGLEGGYREADVPDAKDLYGRSKLLGEVDYPNAVTLRTSIIGHELGRSQALIGWFLAQEARVKGFRKAIFSGLPTVELARVIRDHVLPNSDLRGLYHVSAEPIAKYDLLKLVADVYGKMIEIVPDDSVSIDRSLNSDRFRLATAYSPPAWPTLITQMHEFG
ncbi:dTDP-4-dehydrorhamnose reductase family protein [Devosia albogilva]|uniref:dTDP-4-dehydrorhamnose reductase n=1 Tax=Devosia albogilva TaxID=429726 RepID=A0ABW5QN83_9HYPH